MDKLKRYRFIEVVRADKLTRLFLDRNRKHEANVRSFEVRFVYQPDPEGGTSTQVIPCTLEDLKELRKAVRRAIKDESNKHI